MLEVVADPLAAAHAEIAPDEASAGRLTLRYETNAPPLPGESPRDALARRLAETADKEIWNGSTLIGPHRDDLVFEFGGRDLATFASRGQQRTAILALKLAELDVVTGDRRTPAAPPARRRLLRARPGATLAPGPADRRTAPGVHHDHDARRPRRLAARGRDRLGGPGRSRGRRPRAGRHGGPTVSTPRRRPMVRLGDLIPDAARALGLEDELRLSRAIATFEALVAERVPAAAGACRVVRIEGFTLDVEADAPIVGAGDPSPRHRADDRLRGRAGGCRGEATSGLRPSRGSPRIIPLTCQPPPEAPIAERVHAQPDRTSSARPRDPPDRGVRQITRGPDGRTAPNEARRRRRT